MTIKVKDKDGKIEGYYLVCHNADNFYQLVSVTFGRIDKRVFKSKIEAFDCLAQVVSTRGSTAEQVDLCLKEKK